MPLPDSLRVQDARRLLSIRPRVRFAFPYEVLPRKNNSHRIRSQCPFVQALSESKTAPAPVSFFLPQLSQGGAAAPPDPYCIFSPGDTTTSASFFGLELKPAPPHTRCRARRQPSIPPQPPVHWLSASAGLVFSESIFPQEERESSAEQLRSPSHDRIWRSIPDCWPPLSSPATLERPDIPTTPTKPPNLSLSPCFSDFRGLGRACCFLSLSGCFFCAMLVPVDRYKISLSCWVLTLRLALVGFWRAALLFERRPALS